MAAKTIEISNDGGTIFTALPGSGGSFSVDGEEINDTILGQTFQSNEAGLISWAVVSDGVFKGFAGYLAELKEGGTPTSMTDESMTLVAGKTFVIDDATREIWDHNSSVTFDDNAVLVPDADILNIDFLFGTVTFTAGYTVTEPITVSGDFVPMTAALGKGQTYNLTMTMDPTDKTDFATAQANAGFRVFGTGLRSVALELGGFFDATVDMKTKLTARSEILIEIDAVGDGLSIARGFFRLSTDEQSGDVGALEEETTNFVLNVPDVPKMLTPFSWRHDATSTLNQAIQDAIDAWVGEIDNYDIRYLPVGVIGESPLDGISGEVVFTNISLSGGLSNMNVFNIETMGVGAYAKV